MQLKCAAAYCPAFRVHEVPGQSPAPAAIALASGASRPSASSPPSCGSSASSMSRIIAKSSPLGRSIPPESHATTRAALSVCGSAASATVCIAASSARRRSFTASSRSRQFLPTPPAHSRSRAAIASVSAALAVSTAGVTRAGARHRHVRDVEAREADACRHHENEGNDPDQPAGRRREALGARPMRRRQQRASRARSDQRPRQWRETATRRTRSNRAIGRTQPLTVIPTAPSPSAAAIRNHCAIRRDGLTGFARAVGAGNGLRSCATAISAGDGVRSFAATVGAGDGVTVVRDSESVLVTA